MDYVLKEAEAYWFVYQAGEPHPTAIFLLKMDAERFIDSFVGQFTKDFFVMKRWNEPNGPNPVR